ncbi:MAG TPA: ABC transporter ATP-binding protein, partial [Candidatus Woesebacteria bacterium]|nr:ABC transporter ATP-binding protein [Candidatus Woesebacteria bacterium]
MSNTVIKFQNVTKKFAFQSQKTFKEFLPALIKGEETSKGFTALDNISFEIEKSDSMGIIGPNGSGKSTILKLIAGVMSPTVGKVEVKGQISPLIELGAGMHPELTGRENIYLNGAILGLKKKQIDTNLQSIIDFSEIEEFIDQPVKHYSSGMYMRLAFAIAVHVNPEILIVDEILAVGDVAFQEKCFRKMEEFKQNGVTIIFVSHSLEQIKRFCNKAI